MCMFDTSLKVSFVANGGSTLIHESTANNVVRAIESRAASTSPVVSCCFDMFMSRVEVNLQAKTREWIRRAFSERRAHHV